MTNFHTHVYLCKHAEGSPNDYAKVAEREGLTALGFSDHCPYPDGTWGDVRMDYSDLPTYLKLVAEAKATSKVPIYLGYECEWHKRYKNFFTEVLIGEHKANYLVFGPHWVQIDNTFKYVPRVTEKENLIKYVDQTIEGMESGLFAFLAHPDLFLEHVEEITPFHLDISKKIIEASVALKMPIEVNGNGCTRELITRNGKPEYRYPVTAFWRLAKELGAHIVLSADAHIPEHLASNRQKAIAFATDLGLTVDYTFMPKFFN